ncbi:MAG: D-amino-acid transaminase [Ignavibacteriaceae bacterium]
MITYFNGSFLPVEDVRVSPFDRGFQFGDGVYEAITTYNSKLFLYEEHLERLKRSLSEIKINFAGINGLKEIIYELIKKNGLLNNVSVYIQITRGAGSKRMHVFPSSDIKPTIFISAAEIKGNQEGNKTGVKVILEKDIRWERCDIKTIMLLPAVMAKQKAAEQGAYEAIWVKNGFIKEGAHTNFFAVKGNEVYTPPLTNTILPGITRQFVIFLCKKNNIKVNEEEIPESGINSFNEFFITGTTTEIKPVVQINGVTVKDGKPGSLTSSLQDLFYKAINN